MILWLTAIMFYLMIAAAVTALIMVGIDLDTEGKYPLDKGTILLAAMLWPLTIVSAIVYALAKRGV